ncbi:hypothetical protein J2T13_000374 [Paenibacillus sp. DS2015]|uniref:copper amine oxidase N-terminal domain-containing protein n=1 Tax=Paenibacillus sp. DS2015 TaxID=3373917 RepID=UPI003D20702D
MKKVLLSMTVAALFLGTFAIPTEAAKSTEAIEVLLNAKKISFPDAKPFQDAQGSVMVPIRFVSEALGAKVSWSKADGKTTVEIYDDEHKVKMVVGQATADVNGKEKSYGTKIILKQNRTFVPLRLVSEGLGQTVSWDKVGRWVWIGSKEALTLEESGLKSVSITPYKKYFGNKSFLIENSYDIKHDKVILFKRSDLPSAFIDDFYTIDYEKKENGLSYIKVRTKTRSETPGNIFFLTEENHPRYRNPVYKQTIKHGDGTKTFYYPLVSWLDELDGIKNYTNFKIKEVLYIGFDLAADDYIPLLKNPWK